MAWPWLAPYRESLQALATLAPPHATVAEALNSVLAARAPIVLAAGWLRFAPERERGPGEAYEAFIARTACVPTRDNLHDLFNGLVWLRFPAVKRHLNALQAREIAMHGASGPRGAVRDGLTLFDENAALWAAPTPLAEALRRRDWRALFVTHRAMCRAAPPLLFGHALMEKLMQPRKPITAHVWLLPEAAEPESFLVASLTAQALAAKTQLPLPVLGVPGWWPANESDDFYDDAHAFRPPQ